MRKAQKRLREIRRRLRRRLRQRAEARRNHHPKRARRLTGMIRYLKHLRTKLRRQKERIATSHREGVDWSYGNIDPQALHDAGKSFVCRYLSHDPGKNLTRTEAERYSNAGIDLVVVWESGSNNAALGYSQGRSDANTALAQAKVCGMPEGRPIFFAVDFDAAGPEIAPYFEGVAAVLGRDHSGIYAGLDAVEYILDRKIVDWAWQTYAWSNHKWDKRAHLRQVLISLTGAELRIDGVVVDYDKSTAVDFGQWRVK